MTTTSGKKAPKTKPERKYVCPRPGCGGQLQLPLEALRMVDPVTGLFAKRVKVTNSPIRNLECSKCYHQLTATEVSKCFLRQGGNGNATK